MLYLSRIFPQFLLVLLVGCASAPAVIPNEIGSSVAPSALDTGKIRLTCLLSCAGTWGAASTKARALHDNNLWVDLAALVSRIGYESDLGYYYLGRSAESLGYRQAAIAYYRLSIASRFKCDGFINNCDRINVPSEALTRLDTLLQATDTVAISATPSPIPAGSGFTQSVSNTPRAIQPARAEELQYGARIEVTYDEFKKVTAIEGSQLKDKDALIFLRAWKSDTESTKFQLYVVDSYGGKWRFYADAWDSDGKKMPVTLINREVENCSRYGCVYTEHVGIEVKRDYLQTRLTSGIRLKISGNGGEVVISVPASYIAAFLEAAK